MIERLDNAELHDQYQKRGRIQIPEILTPESAELIHKNLSEQTTWNLVWNNNGEHTDMDLESVEKWTPEQRQDLYNLIVSQSDKGFQYYYANIPIYDIHKNQALPGHFFHQIYEFVNSDDFLNCARAVTGNQKIEFADVQATRYSSGHFLTGHDDNVADKGRVAAYVLNLTPEWNPDWGGALLFHERVFNQDAFLELLFPTFNALNIFSVPQRHSVTMVSPFAKAHRYSITGWLRHN